MVKRILALFLILSLLCCAAIAEDVTYDTGKGVITLPAGWTAAEDNRVISLHGAEGAMVLVINSFGAYTARQVLENLLPGVRAQLTQAFTDIAFSEEGTIILCGEREAVRYTFTAEGREYHQYIIPVGEDLWYLTANVTPDTLTDRLIASIAEK